MRIRQRFIPVEEACVGMVLGVAANAVERGLLSLTLPASHVLTEASLGQLVAHHAEFIQIEYPDQRTDEAVADDVAVAARRVLEIFEDADLTEPTLAALFEQVLAYRSA
ncbi:MAG TPA: hypothetical protein PK347_10365 [Burkholderiaceae bacterium]|nr:hypothetical protein [Burkholderiaceae bacterium]